MTARLEDLTGRPYMLDNFEEGWDGIHLVDLEGNVQKFETDKFFHTHVPNTFENETGVVMDIGAFSVIPFSKSPQLDISLFNNKTARDGALSRGQLRRYVFHLEGEQKGQVTWQVVSAPGRFVDFFKMNDKWNGLPYCYVYSDEWFHDGETYASMAVVKQNMCTGERTYWQDKDNYPGEPFFIPGPGPEEDDGLVIFVVHTKSSNLIFYLGATNPSSSCLSCRYRLDVSSLILCVQGLQSCPDVGCNQFRLAQPMLIVVLQLDFRPTEISHFVEGSIKS